MWGDRDAQECEHTTPHPLHDPTVPCLAHWLSDTADPAQDHCLNTRGDGNKLQERTPAFPARCYLHSQRIICYSDILSSSILFLQCWSPLTPVISHPKLGSHAAQSWTTMPYRFPHAYKMAEKQSLRDFPGGPVVKIPCF